MEGDDRGDQERIRGAEGGAVDNAGKREKWRVEEAVEAAVREEQ